MQTKPDWIVMALVLCSLAGAGCKEKEVLTIRLVSTYINANFYSAGRIVFEPTGETEFRQSGGGDWADGAVTYAVTPEGNFEIVMDGYWMTEQARAYHIEHGAYAIELPLKNIEDSGTFLVWAEYQYYDEMEDSWRRIAYGERNLELPYEGDSSYGEHVFGLILECTDPRNEACTRPGPDPDGAEVPDTVDTADVPDIADTSTDTGVPDTASDTSVPDTAPDPVEDTDDPPTDTGSDPPDDAADGASSG
jgi:hypothetical protein